MTKMCSLNNIILVMIKQLFIQLMRAAVPSYLSDANYSVHTDFMYSNIDNDGYCNALLFTQLIHWMNTLMTWCQLVLCRQGTQLISLHMSTILMSLLSCLKTHSALFVNKRKTKELVIMSHHNACHYFSLILINDRSIGAVEEFKYQGPFLNAH